MIYGRARIVAPVVQAPSDPWDGHPLFPPHFEMMGYDDGTGDSGERRNRRLVWRVPGISKREAVH